jgi:hypothetical protein
MKAYILRVYGNQERFTGKSGKELRYFAMTGYDDGKRGIFCHT